MLAYAFYEVDTRIMQYASALVERGDTVDVLALRREGSPAFEVIDGVNVYRIQTRRVNEKSRLAYLFRMLRFLLVSSFVLTKRQFTKPYQVIHVHSVPDFLVFAATLPKLFGARIILDIHDILPEFYASKFGLARDSMLFKLLILTERLSIAFSDHVIIANHLWQDRLVSRSLRREKCTAIINYPDPRLFYTRTKPPANGKFVILYPGTLNRHQGVDVAVRAFALVAGKMPGAQFHIYGEGPDKPSLIQLSNELGLADRVIFHDFLPTAEIAEVMAHSDLAVVPKRAGSSFGNEAASTKIMEFMSVGVPLIVSRTKIDTYYHDDSMVRFFESENNLDLADAIFQLWSSPGLRLQLVAAARQYIERNTWDTKKKEYLGLVDNLCPPVSGLGDKVANRC
jgi:glycosyltransferase involved in cell wall biosynthesis